MTFKSYEQVIVLNMWISGERFDVGGRYIETVKAGPKKGQYKVNVNTRDLYFDPERVMNAEEYNDAIRAGSVPAGAVGVQLFVEGF